MSDLSDQGRWTKKSHTLVIVVTYNGAGYVRECLQGINRSTTSSVDILCFDNASTDATTEIIEDEFAYVHLIKSPRNLGFGKACNVGFDLAFEHSYSSVLLVNQDAILNESSLDILLGVSAQSPDFGILSPIHLYDFKSLDHLFLKHVCAHAEPAFLTDCVLGLARKKIYQTTFVNAAIWLIRMNCLQVLKEFDPIFPHYGEDDDFCDRAVSHGFLIGLVPDATAIHTRPQKAASKLKLKGLQGPENRRHVELLLIYKRMSGNKPRRILYILRLVTIEIFSSVILFDATRLVANIAAAYRFLVHSSGRL